MVLRLGAVRVVQVQAVVLVVQDHQELQEQGLEIHPQYHPHKEIMEE